MTIKHLVSRIRLVQVFSICVHVSLRSLKFMTVLKLLDLIKPIQAQWQTALVNAVLWNKQRQTGRSQQQGLHWYENNNKNIVGAVAKWQDDRRWNLRPASLRNNLCMKSNSVIFYKYTSLLVVPLLWKWLCVHLSHPVKHSNVCHTNHTQSC